MVAALISVYFPSESVIDHVRAIASQVDRVYICDNSPEPNASLFAELDSGDNIQHTCFRENLGLSRAFNRILMDPGIAWQENDAVFFFDQDSRIEEGHVEKMLAVSAQLCAGGWDVGCLGPVYFNTSSGTVEIPKAKKWLVGETYGVSSFCRFMTTSSDNNTSADAISVLTGIVLLFFQQGIDLTSQRLGEHDTHGIKHP